MFRLADLLLTIQLAFVGLVFVPVIRLGGMTIELSNVASLMLVASLALYGIPHLRAPPILNWISLVLLMLGVGFIVRGGQGLSLVVMSTLSVLAAFAVSNMPAFTSDRLVRVVSVGFCMFVGLLWFSASVAGKDLFGGMLDYLSSLNRSVFVFQVLRPTFNAFSLSSDVEYVASVLNAVALTFTIFFVICLPLVRESHRALIICIFSGLAIFILFSSSAVLTAALTSLLGLARWVRFSPNKLGPVLFAGLVVATLVMVSGDLLAYLAVNFSGDAGSRSARIMQYLTGLEVISKGLLLGSGMVEVNGHNIHNFFLFSATSAGLLAGLVVAWIYALAMRLLWVSAIGCVKTTRWEHLAVAGLTILFLIRISFGGAGGLPTGVATVALGLALLIRRSLLESKLPAGAPATPSQQRFQPAE